MCRVPRIDVMRQHVFIDTTLFHPVLIRASVDLPGADHVIAGSDWPIGGDKPIRSILSEPLPRSGLDENEQKAIASDNSIRLLDSSEYAPHDGGTSLPFCGDQGMSWGQNAGLAPISVIYPAEHRI